MDEDCDRLPFKIKLETFMPHEKSDKLFHLSTEMFTLHQVTQDEYVLTLNKNEHEFVLRVEDSQIRVHRLRKR